MDVGKTDHCGCIKLEVEEWSGGVDFLMLNQDLWLKGGWNDADNFRKVALE